MCDKMRESGVGQMLFLLDVLGRVVREGYDSCYEELTEEELREFRLSVEEIMRQIIQVVSFGISHLSPVVIPTL